MPNAVKKHFLQSKFTKCRKNTQKSVISPCQSLLYKFLSFASHYHCPITTRASMLMYVKKISVECLFSHFLTPVNPHRFKIFFPRSHLRPYEPLQMGSGANISQKACFSLILLSYNLKNPCIEQTQACLLDEKSELHTKIREVLPPE